MDYFGNILTIYSPGAGDIDAVKNLLAGYTTMIYKCHENTFYIGTETKADARDLRAELDKLNFSYSFFHLGVSAGSYFKAKGLSEDDVNRINYILFED